MTLRGTIIAAFLMCAAPWLVAQAPEVVIDKDSRLLVVTGCLKGEVLTATQVRESDADALVLAGRFRLRGDRALRDELKRYDGRLVEVTGTVKRTALDHKRPGTTIGNTRVVFGGPPMSSDPTRAPERDPIASTVAMQARAVRPLLDTCPLDKR